MTSSCPWNHFWCLFLGRMLHINRADSGPFQASVQGERDALKNDGNGQSPRCWEQSPGWLVSPEGSQGATLRPTKEHPPHVGSPRGSAGPLEESISFGLTS